MRMAKSSASARSQISRFPKSFCKMSKHIVPGPTRRKRRRRKKKKIFHTFVKLYALNHILFFPFLPLSESMQKWLPQSFFNITFILGKCIFKKLFIFHSMSGCYIVLVKIKLLYKLLCTFACITFSYKCCEVGFSQVLGIFFLNITLHFLLALSQILRHKISCWCNLNNFLIEVLHFRRKII